MIRRMFIAGSFALLLLGFSTDAVAEEDEGRLAPEVVVSPPTLQRVAVAAPMPRLMAVVAPRLRVMAVAARRPSRGPVAVPVSKVIRYRPR